MTAVRESPTAPLHEITLDRRVEFADTDMAGLIHFSRYLVFMEEAEHSFRRAIDWGVEKHWNDQRIGWPRLACGMSFRRPVRFEDVLAVRVFVLEMAVRSLTFGCEFRLGDEMVARGQMSSACCILESGRPPRAIPIPEELRARLIESSQKEKQAWESPIRPVSA